MRQFPCFLIALLAGGMTSQPTLAEETAMQKLVTQEASFVVYAPQGWTASEDTKPGCRTLIVRDPSGTYEASLTHGVDLLGGQAKELLPSLMDSLTPPVSNLSIRKAYTSDNEQRLVCDGLYERPEGTQKAFRPGCACRKACSHSRGSRRPTEALRTKRRSY